MTAMIALTSRSSRGPARAAVSSPACRPPAHLRSALLTEARKRAEQMEQPAPAIDDDLGQALLATAQRTMVEVNEALTRWAKGSYGLCLRCENQIPVARLELRPWAPHCVECATR
jgi:RNA polymerase-binding transcription factor DksA